MNSGLKCSALNGKGPSSLPCPSAAWKMPCAFWDTVLATLPQTQTQTASFQTGSTREPQENLLQLSLDWNLSMMGFTIMEFSLVSVDPSLKKCPKTSPSEAHPLWHTGQSLPEEALLVFDDTRFSLPCTRKSSKGKCGSVNGKDSKWHDFKFPTLSPFSIFPLASCQTPHSCFSRDIHYSSIQKRLGVKPIWDPVNHLEPQFYGVIPGLLPQVC